MDGWFSMSCKQEVTIIEDLIFVGESPQKTVRLFEAHL